MKLLDIDCSRADIKLRNFAFTSRRRGCGYSRMKEDTIMRYTQPKIIATFQAVSTIKGFKDMLPIEQNVNLLTSSAAYHADE